MTKHGENINDKRPTVRSDWTMPPSPSPEHNAYAYCVGGDDGWDLYWATAEENERGEDHDASIPWPFGYEEWAEMEDFLALGFLDGEA